MTYRRLTQHADTLMCIYFGPESVCDCWQRYKMKCCISPKQLCEGLKVLEYTYCKDNKIDNRAEFEKHTNLWLDMQSKMSPECEFRGMLLKIINDVTRHCKHVAFKNIDKWGTHWGENFSQSVLKCSASGSEKVELHKFTCTAYAYATIISAIYKYHNLHCDTLPAYWSEVLVHSFNSYLTNTLLYLHLQKIIVSRSGSDIKDLRELIDRIKAFCNGYNLKYTGSELLNITLPNGYYCENSEEKGDLKAIIKWSIGATETRKFFSFCTEGMGDIKSKLPAFIKILNKALSFLHKMDSLVTSSTATQKEWDRLKNEINDFFFHENISITIPSKMKVSA